MRTNIVKLFWIAATLICFVGINERIFAHSVQMAYCANCQGSLRIWIEHWHGNQAVGTTTMTISLTVGGVTTTTTGSPLSNLQNTPYGQLPGCNSQLVKFAFCPGLQNNYQDWVNYDFPGVPCGVPVSITMLSGNSAFTMDGCNMMPASTGIFTIPCNINKSTSSFIAPPAVCVGTPMTFQDNSTGGNPNLFYDWDFGDGSPNSNAQSPTHIYAAAGTYCVTLRTRITQNGCEDDTTICVVVEDLPLPQFASAPKCSGYGTPFTDQSTIPVGSISQWFWRFGDGNTSANQNPIHTYATCGTFTVTLITTSAGGCVDSISQNVLIPCTPVANFTHDTACFGSPMMFSDLSTVNAGNIVAWFWDFGNNQGTSGQQNPAYTYPNSGTYTVTLTVTSNDGCVATYQRQVTVWPSTTANFIATTVCLGSPTNFTDLSTSSSGVPNNWQWDFGGQGAAQQQHPSFQFNQPGTYQVKLVVGTGPVCHDSVVINVAVHDMPTAAFVATDVCFGNAIPFIDNSNIGTGQIVSHTWNFGDGIGTSNQQSPTYNYLAPGSYNVTQTVTSDQGCTNTITNTVNVHALPVVDFMRSKVCDGDAMVFTNLTSIATPGQTNWIWNFGGYGNSALQNPTYTFPIAGTFNVKLIAVSPEGCIDSIIKPVVVNHVPLAQFVADELSGCQPLCPNFSDLSSIAGGAIKSWEWTFGNGYSSTQQNPTQCYINETSAPRVYDVTLEVKSDSGCTATAVKFDYITVFPTPTAAFDADPAIASISNPEISFTNYSVGQSTWLWEFGDGTISTTLLNPEHEYQDTGRYNVWLYVENTWGCRDSIEKLVRIKPEAFVYIPNAFTPGSDGINDGWSAKFDGVVEAETFIFNRWGELIWEGHELSSAWYGTYNDEPVKSDSYVYLVKVKTVLGEYKEFRGRLALLK